MKKSMRTRVPVFPLPGVVLFPNSILSLHIFEVRYREMLRDIMPGDREFVVLNSNADKSSGHIGCIAKIVQASRRADGRSDIITVGGERVKIMNYFQGKTYLTADGYTVHDDKLSPSKMGCVTDLRAEMNQLVALIKRVYKKDLQCTFSDDAEPEELSFIATGMLELDADEQQVLLNTERTDERIELILPKIKVYSKELAAMAAIESAFGSM